jgi:TldD protein
MLMRKASAGGTPPRGARAGEGMRPVSRREVVALGIVAACTPPRAPTVPPFRVEDVLGRALDAAKRAGATYADARVVRRRDQGVSTREDHVIDVSDNETYGIGVRVLVVGRGTQAWGFAASEVVDEAHAARAAERAARVARANAGPRKRPIVLAPVATYRDKWITAFEVDPFDVPISDKAALLRDIWSDVRAVKGAKYMDGNARVLGEHKIFASTEGSLIEQRVVRVEARYGVTATDDVTGEFVSRHHELPPMQAGWEYITRSSLRRDARKIAEDAVEKLRAPSVTPGKRDLVLAPSNLWLVIHESIGHSTELDRALGYEANFAGTSFATPDQIGKLEYAHEDITFFADKTSPCGLATWGYDDDGEKTQKWNLIEKGKLVAFQTTRDQAAWIGEKRSRGCSFAEDYASIPFQRMPNVSLAPGPKDTSLEDMIAATDDGVLITGDGSWSIDHQRYNFQFGGQMFYAIKGGKLAGAIRDVAYQSNTVDFWHSCDMLGGSRHHELHGSLVDGKGEPAQSNPVSHGCPPARFRNVNILDTKRKS